MTHCKLPPIAEDVTSFEIYHPSNCVKEELEKLVIKYTPEYFHTNDMQFVVYRNMMGYTIYISNYSIPPYQPNVLGNWTNNPLYFIEFDKYGEYDIDGFVR